MWQRFFFVINGQKQSSLANRNFVRQQNLGENTLVTRFYVSFATVAQEQWSKGCVIICTEIVSVIQENKHSLFESEIQFLFYFKDLLVDNCFCIFKYDRCLTFPHAEIRVATCWDMITFTNLLRSNLT